MRVLAVTLGVVSVLGSACVTQSNQSGPSAELGPWPASKVIASSYYVRQLDGELTDDEYDAVVDQLVANKPIESKFFRQHEGPRTIIPVACDETSSIGVLFTVSVGVFGAGSTRHLRTEWYHNISESPEPVRSWNIYQRDNRWQWRNPHLRDGQPYYADYLSLSEERQIDGIWTLIVYARGRELLREDFEFYNCPGDYVPEWYEETE